MVNNLQVYQLDPLLSDGAIATTNRQECRIVRECVLTAQKYAHIEAHQD